MSTLSVANVIFESTGANRIEYTGNNVIRVKGAGLQLPVVTNATKPSPEAGMMLYNSDTGNMEMMGAGGAGLSFASNTSVGAAFAVANAGFGKANTALQNTSGTFSGALTVTGGVSVPNEGSGGYYTSLNSSGTGKIILSLSNNGMAADATRLRSAGGGVSIENSSASTLMSILENGNVGIGTLSPGSRLQTVAPAGQLAAFGNTSSNVNSWIGVSTGSQSVTWGIDVDNIAYTYTPGAYKIFSGGANERLRITSSGDIGIGNTTPVSKLDLTGTMVIRGSGASFPATGTGLELLYNGTGDFGQIQSYSRDTSSWKNLQIYSGNTLFITTGSERMRVDNNGYVTKQNQPFVRVNTNTTGISLSVGTTVVVPFNNVLEQTGSNYNNSTYRFTCPVAGKYMVTAAVQGQNLGSNWYNLFIRLNGSGRFGTYMTGLNVGYQPLYTYGIMNCAVGDYIDCAVQPNVTGGSLELNNNDSRTMFCVYFLG